MNPVGLRKTSSPSFSPDSITTKMSLLSPVSTGRRSVPVSVLTQQNAPSGVSITAATGTLNTSSYSARITSTSALIPGTAGSSIIVSYFTTFPVHQPAG